MRSSIPLYDAPGRRLRRALRRCRTAGPTTSCRGTMVIEHLGPPVPGRPVVDAGCGVGRWAAAAGRTAVTRSSASSSPRACWPAARARGLGDGFTLRRGLDGGRGRPPGLRAAGGPGDGLAAVHRGPGRDARRGSRTWTAPGASVAVLVDSLGRLVAGARPCRPTRRGRGTRVDTARASGRRGPGGRPPPVRRATRWRRRMESAGLVDVEVRGLLCGLDGVRPRRLPRGPGRAPAAALEREAAVVHGPGLADLGKQLLGPSVARAWVESPGVEPSGHVQRRARSAQHALQGDADPVDRLVVELRGHGQRQAPRRRAARSPPAPDRGPAPTRCPPVRAAAGSTAWCRRPGVQFGGHGVPLGSAARDRAARSGPSCGACRRGPAGARAPADPPSSAYSAAKRFRRTTRSSSTSSWSRATMACSSFIKRRAGPAEGAVDGGVGRERPTAPPAPPADRTLAKLIEKAWPTAWVPTGRRRPAAERAAESASSGTPAGVALGLQRRVVDGVAEGVDRDHQRGRRPGAQRRVAGTSGSIVQCVGSTSTNRSR